MPELDTRYAVSELTLKEFVKHSNPLESEVYDQLTRLDGRQQVFWPGGLPTFLERSDTAVFAVVGSSAPASIIKLRGGSERETHGGLSVIRESGGNPSPYKLDAYFIREDLETGQAVVIGPEREKHRYLHGEAELRRRFPVLCGRDHPNER